MKKYILATLIAFLLTPSLAMAVSDENITKRRPDSPANIEVQEIRQERQEVRTETRTQLQEMRSNVAENHANRLEKRFTAYYTRLNNIITRFQSRLDILKSDGRDTTSTQAKLTAAKNKLGEAKVKGDEAVAGFKAIDPAKFSEQKTQVLAARDLANSARKLFVDTHTLLKSALNELKSIGKPAKEAI